MSSKQDENSPTAAKSIEQSSVTTTPGAKAPPGVTKKQCVACHESIHAEARLCPHCGSAQAPARWTMIGASLKWVGGITAVVSLVLATWQLRDLVQATREKVETVAELVRAADLQQAAGNYESALALIDDAMKLDPSSRKARALQVTIAMAKVRKLHAPTVTFSSESVLQGLEPSILYRGAAQTDPQGAADALAHVGWMYHLQEAAGEKEGLPIEDFFRRALKLDPDNVFAHTMWADWCLHGDKYIKGVKYTNCANQLQTAVAHYAAALKGGRERQFVYESILDYFCRGDMKIRLKQCAIFFDDMRNDGYILTPKQKDMVREGVDYTLGKESEFTVLMKETDRAHIINAIRWIATEENFQEQPIDDPSSYGRRMWAPRLKELAGKAADALLEYKQIGLDARKLEGQDTTYLLGIFPDIDLAVARLIDLRSGWLGLDLRKMDEDQAAQGLGRAQQLQVERVSPASPAHQAGIVPGDVILAINGQDPGSPAAEFLLRTAVAGDTAELTVWRRGQAQKLNVAFADIPAEERKDEISSSDFEEVWFLGAMVDKEHYGPRLKPLPEFGLTLAELTDELRSGYQIPAEVRGALVLNNERSEHHRDLDDHVGAGDVIVEANQRPVSEPDDLVRASETARTPRKKPAGHTFSRRYV